MKGQSFNISSILTTEFGIELSNKNLCAECPLRNGFKLSPDIQINKIHPSNQEIEFDDENAECFLKRGILCLGPITREGCDYECIKQGIPCEGCLGPISKEFTANIINFLSLLSLNKKFKKYKGLFYRFSKPKIWR